MKTSVSDGIVGDMSRDGNGRGGGDQRGLDNGGCD